MGRKYFGTDGVRGRVGMHPITPQFVMNLGYAAGKVLAKGSPGDIRQRASTPTTLEPSMEDAFIAIVQDARVEQAQLVASAPKEAA
jgi:phosphomannomutase